MGFISKIADPLLGVGFARSASWGYDATRRATGYSPQLKGGLLEGGVPRTPCDSDTPSRSWGKDAPGPLGQFLGKCLKETGSHAE